MYRLKYLFYPVSLEIIVHVVSSFRLPGSTSGFLSPYVLVGNVHHKVELCKFSAGLLLRRLPGRLRNTKYFQVAIIFTSHEDVTWYKLATLEFFRRWWASGDFPLWLIFPHIPHHSRYIFSHPERTAGARHVVEAPPEALGHDGVQDGVEDGVKVVEDTGHHEEHVLGLRQSLQWRKQNVWTKISCLLQPHGPFSVESHNNEHQTLTVKWDPADEKRDNNGDWKQKKTL